MANLVDHAVAALGLERLLLVLSAQKKTAAKSVGFLNSSAVPMLSTVSYNIPQAEQAVRPTRLAEFVEVALHGLPPGAHVASPELLWQAP